MNNEIPGMPGCPHMNRDVVDLDWLYFSVPGNALIIFYLDLKQLFQKVW